MHTQICDILKDNFFYHQKEKSKEVLLDTFNKLKINTILDYEFNDIELFINALTHKSFSHEAKNNIPNNERLEFLGDSILSLIVTNKIFALYKDVDEGLLSKLRTTIVSESSLCGFARKANLGNYILLGAGELKNNGQDKDSILADTFEAILGAILIDSNYETVEKVLLTFFESFDKKDIFPKSLDNVIDPKTKLQNLVVQKYKTNPNYIVKESQKDNKAFFEVALTVDNKTILTKSGDSKKRIKKEIAIEVLKNNLI
ncbi:MAG: ribonuclease III [Bacteriovoracaceae bacterium]|jgi:ribonuclease-3|nr:ribonuclease III [Bacteriovoracaceae bacterium]